MRQIALFAAGICLPFLAGCIPVAIPTVDYTPPVSLEARRDEVHAFRVDITNMKHDLPWGLEFQELSEIPATNSDEVPAQVKPSITNGIVVVGIALNYFYGTSHDMALRLYRPGYELIEIKSWQQKNRVVWKPAADAAAQEHAVDELVPASWVSNGSVSRAHANALLYGASEYERLAKDAGAEMDRNRLSAKANKLREIAADIPQVRELP